MPDERIRRIRPSDVPAAVQLAYDLAEYERAPDECHLTAPTLHAALFGEAKKLFCTVAEVDGELAVVALFVP